jgi:hypothetical protein
MWVGCLERLTDLPRRVFGGALGVWVLPTRFWLWYSMVCEVYFGRC